MKIVVLSDTHGRHTSIKIPKGDIIIHCGDVSPSGTSYQVDEFLKWYGDLDFKKKILIAGNHDWDFETNPNRYSGLEGDYGVIYLNDSGFTYKGIKIWGSPVQPEFYNWAFNRKRNSSDIQKHWDLIPKNTDILITHGPPYKVLDKVLMRGINKGDYVGCELLKQKVEEVRPKLHAFGHIHEARGVQVDKTVKSLPTTYCNASSLDFRYQPYNSPAFVFEWNKLLVGKSQGLD